MISKAEKEIVCIAQFTARQGKQDELLAELHKLMEPTHKEPGYIRYELNHHLDNPQIITFVEKFRSRDDFDFHCNTPYIKEFFTNRAPSLVESQSINLYREVLP
jgi:quinol monooxygenase YgiN